jgi:hypothetical protein
MIRRRVGIITPHSRQLPFLEWDNTPRRWRVWQSYNPDISAGTYLDLYGTNPLDQRFVGQVDRVTIGPDGSVRDITTVLPPWRDE